MCGSCTLIKVFVSIVEIRQRSLLTISRLTHVDAFTREDRHIGAAHSSHDRLMDLELLTNGLIGVRGER